MMTKSALISLVLLLTACDSGSVTSQESSSVEQEQPVLIINGHTLPPEPDPEENSATLVGIDINNNGVRDDVERWIYQTYQNKHPIYIDIAMQEARAWQKVMEAPASMAKTTVELVHAAIGCESYYKIYADFNNEKVLVKEDISSKWKVLNNQDRKSAFMAYDKALSGGVYSLPHRRERQRLCDFDTSKYEN